MRADDPHDTRDCRCLELLADAMAGDVVGYDWREEMSDSKRPDYVDDLCNALSHQQQADMDGVLCTVSRQAVDEAIGLIRRARDAQLTLTAERDALKAEVAEKDAALDAAERELGQPWRFWSEKACEISKRNTSLKAEVERLREVLGNIDKETTHVSPEYDNLHMALDGAHRVARDALQEREGK